MRTVKLTAIDNDGEVFELSDPEWGCESNEYLAHKYQNYCEYYWRKAGFIPVSITVEVF